MAELVKKLKLQNTKGVVESCTLYSTKEEANAMGGVLPLHVDGVDCFAALGAVTESEVTSGRQEKNGVSLAILKQGGITPGSITLSFSRFNSDEYQNFTVPVGVKVLRINSTEIDDLSLDDTYYMPASARQTLSVTMFLFVEMNNETGEDEYYMEAYVGAYAFSLGGKDDRAVTLSWSEQINKHTAGAKKRQ